jgi:hypothetical protein
VCVCVCVFLCVCVCVCACACACGGCRCGLPAPRPRLLRAPPPRCSLPSMPCWRPWRPVLCGQSTCSRSEFARRAGRLSCAPLAPCSDLEPYSCVAQLESSPKLCVCEPFVRLVFSCRPGRPWFHCCRHRRRSSRHSPSVVQRTHVSFNRSTAAILFTFSDAAAPGPVVLFARPGSGSKLLSVSRVTEQASIHFGS